MEDKQQIAALPAGCGLLKYSLRLVPAEIVGSKANCRSVQAEFRSRSGLYKQFVTGFGPVLADRGDLQLNMSLQQAGMRSIEAFPIGRRGSSVNSWAVVGRYQLTAKFCGVLVA